MIASRRLTRLLAALVRSQSAINARPPGVIPRHLSVMAAQTPKTAGIIVIGDEILKGQTLDTNSHKICKRFYKMGFKVKRTVIIPDDVNAIAEQVAQFASLYDYVVTTGGVGPTHDDVTYEGVAKGFGLRLVRHPALVQLLENYFGTSNPSHPALKMSEVPETASILWSTGQQQIRSFPLVAVKNVYVLPGIPSYMERCLQCLYDVLEPNATQAPNVVSVYVALDEVSITDTLNSAVRRFEPSVTFGSYPSTTNNYYRVHLTMESDDGKKLEEARAYLRDALPQGALVPYQEDPVGSAMERLYHFLESPDPSLLDVAHQLRRSVQYLEECLTRSYAPDQVCISFNGGKDCTALLHLYHCVLRKWFPDRKKPLTGMYVKCKNPFPEVESFITDVSERYNLQLDTRNGPIKNGLEEFLISRPEIKAILIGNRQTDPGSDSLRVFQMTDPDWPQVIRVFPLLDWSYSEIWKFIRHFCIPYCSLYDRGYTSLGSIHNTSPNPNLGFTDAKGEARYHPAYMLGDNTQERNGRH